MRMFECVPYIKSICHQVWITEWHHNHDDDVETRQDDTDRVVIKGFHPKVRNSSLCVVDDLIVNAGSDEFIQQRSSDVIVPKYGNEHHTSMSGKEGRKVGRILDEIIINSR